MTATTNPMDPINLQFWAENNYNVLLEGSHGTGKTASIKATFTKLFGEPGVDWLYFSAATMDAWVDFVGVPREVVDADGQRYLDLIRPRALANDTVKAIFFDEFNRAPAKTRNAVMELLQFKSINGKKFHNMKVIWAAINPEGDDVYDVERLDPAQEDRFDVKIKVPYDVTPSYFFETYGKAGEAACVWWRNLDEDVQKMISPRRLEVAIRMFKDGGDIGYCLPPEANTQELIVQLQDGTFRAEMLRLFSTGDKTASREALINENFYNGVQKDIFDFTNRGMDLVKFFVPLMPNEKIAKVFNAETKVRTWMTSDLDYKDFAHIFDSVIAINSTREERERNQVQTSTISNLRQWKRSSGGDGQLNDVEYINMVSDERGNVHFFRDEKERDMLLDRLVHIINVNTSLDKPEYVKMIGPLVELFRASHKADIVVTYIKKLGSILSRRFESDIYTLMTNTLPGLRTGRNPTAFAKAKDDLVKEGAISEPTQL